MVAKLIICYVLRGFKALKQTVKLHYRVGNYKQMMDAYREMLTYIKSAVTRNYSEKCINNILDFVSNGANQNLELLQEFYQTTLKALEEARNEVNLPLYHFISCPNVREPNALLCSMIFVLIIIVQPSIYVVYHCM